MPVVASPTVRTFGAALRSWIARFRDVLATPGLRGVVVASAVARLPKGMAPLSLVVFVHDSGHSYAVAGAVAGAVAALLATGDAGTTPWQGRLVDAHGLGRVLVPAAALHVGAVVALSASGGAPASALAGMALVAGVGLPPVSGCVKAALPDLVPPDRSTTAYAVESLVQQAVFLVGPLLVTVLIATAGPIAALCCSAACTGAGTVWFVFALGRPCRPGSPRPSRAAW